MEEQSAAREVEWYEENGEYETEIEKGGEVALEQFHISYLMNKHLNFRFGHMIVPVGLTNAHHEPLNFSVYIVRKERLPYYLLLGMRRVWLYLVI